VLSEIPDDWWPAVGRWREMNAPWRQTIEDQIAPDANEECLLYQTLLGAWPLEPYDAEGFAAFVERIQAYMKKALHEAKVHTSWINPNDEYDNAVLGFVGAILDETNSAAYLEDFAPFRRRVAHFGIFNSLAQTLLKITSPGVADIYQGTEIWDFSLVDPDNRRPVDYERRMAMLADLQEAAANARDRRQFALDLLTTKEDGRIKLFVNYQALHCRRAYPGLFSTGAYTPLEVTGTAAEHVFAFLRGGNSGSALVVVPRLLTKLSPDIRRPPLGRDVWGDTRVVLPEAQADGVWRNVFTEEKTSSLALAELFQSFPVALLVDEQTPLVVKKS
jgi:(1->4)-alpha-D-glucan 1-alpha-D-glucosylmutase